MSRVFRPFPSFIVVKPVAPEEVTATGLLLSPGAVEAPPEGVVVSVGTKACSPDMPLSQGQRVLYRKYSGVEATLGVEVVLILQEADILGVLEEAA